MPNMKTEHKPAIIALVLCDNIYTEPSGKSALVGLFNGISAGSFPAKHPRLAVFVSMTDVHPGSAGTLDIVHGETDNPIVEAKGEFQEVERTDVVDMSFILNNVTFPEPGLYFIRFFVNGHCLVQRPFDVREVRSKGEEDK